MPSLSRSRAAARALRVPCAVVPVYAALHAALLALPAALVSQPVHAAGATAPAAAQLHLPAGPLPAALDALARQAGVSVAYDAQALVHLRTSGLHGRMAPAEALALLLQGSGHAASAVGPGRFVVAALPPQEAGAGSAAAMAVSRVPERTLAETTVTGTRMAMDVYKYPGSVGVLGEGDLDGASTLVGALARVPGVAAGGDSGRGLGQQFTIRGFGYQSEDRVIVLQDGVRRSPSLFSNHISSFRSDPDLLKRVEVVKGASSVTHGGGGIGGVVAMVTKDAHDFIPTGADRGFAAKARYESNNAREAYVAGAIAPEGGSTELLVYGKRGRIGGITLARAVDFSATQKSDTVDNREDVSVLFVKGTWKPDAAQRLSLSLYDYSEDAAVTWQTLYHPGYSTVSGPVYGTLSQRDLVASYTLRPPQLPWVNLGAVAYASRAGYDRGYTTTAAPPSQLRYENTDKRWGLRVHNQFDYEALGARHRLLVGLDHERRDEDALYLLDGVTSDFGSMPAEYRDTGVYVHNEARWWDDALQVQLSGRYDSFRRAVRHKSAAYDSHHFSPRLGVALAVAPGWTLLGSYAEAFRAPTPHETSSEGPLNPHYWYLPNPDLRPEIARELELGLSFAREGLWRASDRMRAKAMFFHGRIQDMIAFKADLSGPASPQGSPYGRYGNYDRVRRNGLELQAHYDAGRAGAGLTFEHLDQRDLATGKKVPQGFADKLRLEAHWRVAAGWRLEGSVSHWFKPDQNPESVVSGKQTYWYVRDSYTQADVALRWTPAATRWARDVELVLGVNNLFDRPYLNAREVETTTRVGKGRNVYVALSSRF